jgi:hypothetical protein
MREILLFVSFTVGLVLLYYAAYLAGDQYALPWLPPFIGGCIGLLAARILSQGVR